jgi:glycosyltransferase involved in cell wall biosynthesis
MSPPADASYQGAPIRLLVVLPDLSGGGAQRVTLRLLSLFDEHRYQITLLVLDGPGELVSLVPPNVRLVYPPRSRLLRVGKLSTMRNALNHDVLIAAMELRASFCVHFAATGLRKPSIGWVRIAFGEYAREISDKNRRKAKQTYGDFDRLVFVSDGAQESFERWYGESRRGDWRRIYNPYTVDPAIDPAVAASAASTSVGKTARPLIVGAGRLEKRKGFDVLIDAVAALKKRGIVVDLALLGEGALADELREQARAQGIADQLQLPGFVQDVGDWLKRATLYVLSSRIEGLPGTILEAFAAGTPVVATRCPHGPEELLQEGKAGLLVPMDDAPAMADAMQSLLESPERRAEFASAGRQRLVDFSADRILPQWEALISELVTPSRST